MDMLYVTCSIQIPEEELRESFIRSSGPGGQNVNKVATAVQLRFNAGKSLALPEEIKAKYADLICAIAPFAKHVNLMFSRGASMPDPDGKFGVQ